VKAIDNAGNSSETFLSFTVLTASTTDALFDNWWFWLALAAAIAFLIFAELFMKRRNLPLDRQSETMMVN
jgi:hypothetical protein